MSSIDQQFIEYIVKSLVGNPDAVVIERTIDEKGVLLELTVDPQDLGRVIGKKGSGAQALRTLLRALGTKNDARYNLKIVDNGDPRPPREDRPVQTEQPKDDQPQEIPEQEAPVADVSEEVAVIDEEEPEVNQSSMAEKTRRELADLDDLDI